MSVILANSYNENDATNIRDYSAKLSDGTGSNMSMVADTFGYYADFDGASSVYSVTGSKHGDTFSYFFEFYADSVTGTQYLMQKANHSEVYLTGGTLTFKVDNGAVSDAANYSTISINTWYRVCCTYDGSDLNIYIDGDIVSATRPSTVSGLTNSAIIYMGNDSSANWYNGRLREFRVYNTALTSINVGFLMASQQGILATLPAHSFNVGDLILQVDKIGNEHRSVIFATDTNEVRVLPMNDNSLKAGFSILRCGHRWDTARQNYFTLDGSGACAEMAIWDGINVHTDLDSDAKKVVKIDCNGITTSLPISTVSATKTANYTLVDNDYTIHADATAGSITQTLPSTPLANKEYQINKIDSSANSVVIAGNGNTINGNISIDLISQYDNYRIRWDATGSEWYIL